MNGVLVDREEPTVAQIKAEWEAIEAKRPGGVAPSIIKLLNSEKAQRATGDANFLLDVINGLHKTIQSYHAEMGVLLSALALPVQEPPLPRPTLPRHGRQLPALARRVVRRALLRGEGISGQGAARGERHPARVNEKAAAPNAGTTAR